MTKATPQVGDKVRIISSEECPDINGKVGTLLSTNYDSATMPHFVVDVYSEEYGCDGTYVDIKTDKYELVVDMPKPAGDMVEQPSHYTQGRFETIEIIEEITKGYDDGYVAYCVGNALKYISRAPYKHADGGLEDIRKAGVYLRFAAEHLETGESA